MQYNTRIHIVKIVMYWFEKTGIEVVDWPPYSQDLNPIEHVWGHLKEWVYTNRLELLEMTGNGENVKGTMLNAL
jgi:transposase